jgi:ATP-binding cassette subfamily C (CFTR/MRP) protein 4
VLTVDFSVSSIDDRHTHGLGMQIDASLTVTVVAKGGQAIAGGIEAGDVITKVGGIDFSKGKTDADAVQALTVAKDAGVDLVIEFNKFGIQEVANNDQVALKLAALEGVLATEVEHKLPPSGRGLAYCPRDKASFWSRLSYAFVNPLLARGAESTLQFEDLDQLSAHDHAETVTSNLKESWEAEKKRSPEKPSLLRALFYSKSNNWPFFLAGFNAFAESASCIAQPIVLGYLITWLAEDGERDIWKGMYLAALLMFASFVQAVVHHFLYFLTMRGGWNTRTATSGLVHAKLLRLSSNALQANSSGKIINLLSNDVARFDQGCTCLHFAWTAPMDFLVVVLLLWLKVGWLSTFAGVAVPTLCLPVQLYLGKRFGRQRRKTTHFTDLRVRAASEVFGGISSVKVAGWDHAFEDRVGAFRNDERDSIFVSQAMKALNLALYFVTPALASLATFSVYYAKGNRLDVATVFSTMSLLNVLRLSIGKNMSRVVENLPEAVVASERITKFLMLEEVRPRDNSDTGAAGLELGAVRVRIPGNSPSSSTPSMGARWTSECVEPVLWSLDLDFSPGSLTLVAGPVGCGKTAFLQLLLGELVVTPIGGAGAWMGGEASYASQKPWIFAGSIRDNICFGTTFDEARYHEVLHACDLDEDLARLTDGDATEIGERGVNLSGGQKVRVGLARAVYARTDVVLLDDPLSAVDPSVGRHLVEKCIVGLLQTKGRTCVLVTHHMQHAEIADQLLVLGRSADEENEGGEGGVKLPETSGSTAVFCGPAEQWSGTKKDEAVAILDVTEEAFVAEVGAKSDSLALTGATAPALPVAEKMRTQLVQPEDRAVGRVSLDTYLSYVRFGGSMYAIFVLVLFTAGQGCIIGADFWLMLWSEEEEKRADGTSSTTSADDAHRLRVYAILTLVTCALAFMRALLFFNMTITASTNLHRAAFKSVVAAPMHFFTSNPLGRILNKFSSDQGQVDEQLPVCLFDTLQIGFMVLGSITVVCTAIPWLLLFFAPLLMLFFALRRYFLSSCREIKRMDSITKSPIFATFSTHLDGLRTIRAFPNRTDDVHSNFVGMLENNGIAWFSWLLVNRWIGFRLDMLSFVVLSLTAVGAVLLAEFSPDSFSPGVAALALVYTISLSGQFQYMVRQSAQVETMVTSVERILYYTRIPAERREILAGAQGKAKESAAKVQANSNAMDMTHAVVVSPPPPSWPSKGALRIEGLRARYRDDLPEILRGVSMSIPGGGCRVGIVGRTGAGKSSLISALFGLNEVCGGRIVIDGEQCSPTAPGDADSSSATAVVPLRRLRDALSLIPQEPHLFSGALRFNLDPFDDHTDEELWRALEAVQLKRFVAESPEQLQMEVAEGGSNLSVGQRQLLSLARAVLRGSKLVVMDECTANVDYATDALIQTTLKTGSSFKGCTLLIIAHRIQTIIDCDLIAVLDAGRLVEFGPPAELVKREGKEAFFAAMVEKSKGKGNSVA